MLSLTMLLGAGGFGLLVVGMLVGVLGTRGGSYLRWSSLQERVFYKPLSGRIGAGIAAVGFLLLPLVFVKIDWGATALTAILCVPSGVFLLRLAGPNELRLNLQDSTYCRVRGWPFRYSYVSGSWADMAGVFVQVIKGSNAGTSYSVGIRGKRFGVMYLGRFEAQAGAEQFASEMMSELSLPRALQP